MSGDPKRQPPDASIRDAVLAFVNAPTWTASQHVLEAQQALLFTDAADQVFANLVQQYHADTNAVRILDAYRTLLARARTEGIEVACAACQPPAPSPEIDPALLLRQANPEDLQQLATTFLAFVQQPGVPERHAYLVEHPELLTNDADGAIGLLLANAQEHGDAHAVEAFTAHRALLHACREREMDAVFADLAQVVAGAGVAPLVLAFINAPSLEAMRTLLANHPALLTEQVDPVFAALLDEHRAHEQNRIRIQQRQALLHTCREQGVDAVFADLAQVAEQAPQMQQFEAAVAHYQYCIAAAQATDLDVAAWQQAAVAGAALRDPAYAGLPVNTDALHANLATTANTLGHALHTAGDTLAALHAFEEAIALYPDFALAHRNRAGTLMRLGHLDEAAEALAHARTLAPDAERLPTLEQELAVARRAMGAPPDGQE